MSQKKIKCGDEKACARCKFKEMISHLKLLPTFTHNALNRCDWYIHHQ